VNSSRAWVVCGKGKEKSVGVVHRFIGGIFVGHEADVLHTSMNIGFLLMNVADPICSPVAGVKQSIARIIRKKRKIFALR